MNKKDYPSHIKIKKIPEGVSSQPHSKPRKKTRRKKKQNRLFQLDKESLKAIEAAYELGKIIPNLLENLD